MTGLIQRLKARGPGWWWSVTAVTVAGVVVLAAMLGVYPGGGRCDSNTDADGPAGAEPRRTSAIATPWDGTDSPWVLTSTGSSTVSVSSWGLVVGSVSNVIRGTAIR